VAVEIDETGRKGKAAQINLIGIGRSVDLAHSNDAAFAKQHASGVGRVSRAIDDEGIAEQKHDPPLSERVLSVAM
jgi:hypothetical protein